MRNIGQYRTGDSNIDQEVSTFNFKRADNSVLSRKLDETDWNNVIGGHNDIEGANSNFVKAVVQAAKSAKVPKYKKNSTKWEDRNLTCLQSQIDMFQAQLKQADIRKTDKIVIEQQIKQKNEDFGIFFSYI